MRDPAAWMGLARSLAVYHGLPHRRRALSRLYAGLLAPGALVFDVGAHVGNRTLTALRLGARVVAVEPHPVFAGFLRRALGGRVEVVEAAVGAHAGRGVLYASRRHPTVSTVAAEWREAVGATSGFAAVSWDDELRVAVTTLDALIARYGAPAFVKLDIEGMEAAALGGLSASVPLVAFEITAATPELTEACLDRLAALGRYRFNYVPGESHRMALADWSDRASVTNAIAQAGDDFGDVYALCEAPAA